MQAKDLIGIPSSATAYVDVDLNGDNSFTGSELGFATATLVNGYAAINIAVRS